MRRAVVNLVIQENRLLLSATLLSALLCIAVWYAAVQQAALRTEAQTAWYEKRRQSAALNAANLPGQYQREKEMIRLLYTTINYRYEFPSVISEIRDFILLHGATPGPMSFKPAKIDLKHMIAYRIHCTATGSYPGLKRLIADLERLDGISTLDGISFATSDPALEKVTLDLNLTIYLQEGKP